MKPPPKPGFVLVVAREWRWLMRDRLAPLLIFGVPLIAFSILVAVFSHPVVRELRTVVVDDDRSQSSRNTVSRFLKKLTCCAMTSTFTASPRSRWNRRLS